MIYGLQDEYYLSKCQNNQFNHNSKVLPFIEGVHELVDNFNKFFYSLHFLYIIRVRDDILKT